MTVAPIVNVSLQSIPCVSVAGSGVLPKQVHPAHVYHVEMPTVLNQVGAQVIYLWCPGWAGA